ncbi:peptidase [Ahrensia marina]|uniref:peptidase n=1 Tax=Ahrensia marina TaxID=1514904 RepID=UPI0035D13420
MTYCVGLLVEDGLVMIADTRTNAGLDNIATFQKLYRFEQPGERSIAIATSGNLAVSQAVMSIMSDGFENPQTGMLETIYDHPTMFRTASYIGRAIGEVMRMNNGGSQGMGMAFDVTMLVGGQVKGGRLRLFMVYSAGNFIEATEDTPYLQIGEHKYGKPILDRAITFKTNLPDAVKIGLISMDSTMRSNLGVGMPIDLWGLRRDALETSLSTRIEPGEPYFHDLQERWSSALRSAHQSIPTPPYF